MGVGFETTTPLVAPWRIKRAKRHGAFQLTVFAVAHKNMPGALELLVGDPRSSSTRSSSGHVSTIIGAEPYRFPGGEIRHSWRDHRI